MSLTGKMGNAVLRRQSLYVEELLYWNVRYKPCSRVAVNIIETCETIMFTVGESIHQFSRLKYGSAILGKREQHEQFNAGKKESEKL
ncbi:hypothetical protein TDB9533_04532 [Thalassocella blandensis]|nr:hypothetical protein TDB9533_04532 [Thalassocella blandensis]